MTRIIVVERSYDCYAYLEGFPETRCYGVGVKSAVRNLLKACPDISGPVEVVYQLPEGFMEAILCRSSRA